MLLLAFRALQLLRPRDEPATHGCSLAAIPPSFPPAWSARCCSPSGAA